MKQENWVHILPIVSQNPLFQIEDTENVEKYVLSNTNVKNLLFELQVKYAFSEMQIDVAVQKLKYLNKYWFVFNSVKGMSKYTKFALELKKTLSPYVI